MVRLRLDPFALNGVSVDESPKKISHQQNGYVGGAVKSIIAGQNVTVNSSDPAHPIVSSVITDGSAVWGELIGTIADQTDLQDKLDNKQATMSVVVSSNPDADYVVDGSNDQVQFNQAYIDLADSGYTGIKKIMAPDQSYTIEGTITPLDGIALQGAGMFQTTFYGVGHFGAVFGTIRAEDDYFTDATFSDFRVDGSSMYYEVYDTGQKGFFFAYTKNLIFRNVHVYNTPATGFGNDFNINCLFDNCMAELCGSTFPGDPGYNGFGIGTGLVEEPQEESVLWVNCIAIDCGNNGFLIERQFNTTFANDPRSYQFTNCYAIRCSRGFKLTGCSGITLTNCKSISSDNEGFLANTLASQSPVKDVQVVGCEARSSGSSGFFFGDDTRFENIVIDDCHASENLGSGFRIAANRLKISGSYGWLNKDAGLYIHSQGANDTNALVVRHGATNAFTIENCNFWNNGVANTNGIKDGIQASGATWPILSMEISNVHCWDDQATATQQCGVNLQARINNLTLNGIETYGNAQAGVKYESNVTGPSKNMKLLNIRSFNNGRGGGTATNLAGVRLSVTATGSSYDNVLLSGIDCYDDQDSRPELVPSLSKKTGLTPDVGILTGDYLYKVTFLNAIGETAGGTTSALVSPSSNKVSVGVPRGPTGTTSRKIYRTSAGGADGTQKLLTTIADNTTTGYADNIADGSLGAAVPTTDTTGKGWVPSAPSAAIRQSQTNVAGVLTGVYTYKITFVNATGETQGSITSSSITAASNQIFLTNIPTGRSDVTARNIYRTAAGGADGTQKLIATIADNTTVVYTDNDPDASLTTDVPTVNTAYIKTQAYGLRLTGTMTNPIVQDSDLRNNLTSAISNTLTNVVFRNVRGYNPYLFYDQGSVTGAITVDPVNGSVIKLTLTADVSITIPSGVTKGDTLTIEFLQDGTGSWTVTSWSSSVALSATFTPRSTANTRSFIVLVWDGVKWADSSRSTSSTSVDLSDYAYLPGIAGGQTLNGGTAASETLNLRSTSNATKGKITLGASSALDEANVALGIGTQSPTFTGHFLKADAVNPATVMVQNSAGSGVDAQVMLSLSTTLGNTNVGASFYADRTDTGSAGSTDLLLRNSSGTTMNTNLTLKADRSAIFAGALAMPIVSKTANYTATATDTTILVDATSGNLVITLPTAVGIDGRQYRIKKTDATANTVTVATTSSQTIDGATTKVISSQYGTYIPVSNGANWVLAVPDSAVGQPLDSTLTALAAYNTNGILTQTAADTFTGRTITGTSNQVTVTNGAGISGNPTLSLPQDIHTGAGPTFNNLVITPTTNPVLIISVTGTNSDNAARGLKIASTLTGTAPAGFEAAPTFTPASNASEVYGFINIAKASPATSIGITRIYGGYNRIDTGSGGGTLTNARTLGIITPSLGSTIPTNVAGVYVQSQGATSVSEAVGVDVLAQATASTTIGMRIATPTGSTAYALQLSGTGGTAASGITLGTDVQLYRSAADTLALGDGDSLAVGTTTGTKLGTATTQKLGLWNATPIVQPTTAGTAATFVANTSLLANDTATFDGYTIGQVVKALRNFGLLA